ncbi:MAG: SPFH domain-containing protein [Candidatus Thorarchaeota archaeon]
MLVRTIEGQINSYQSQHHLFLGQKVTIMRFALQSLEFYLFIILIGLITLFTFAFILSGIKIVKEYERAVILRLGMYKGVKGPGLIWTIPIIDKIAMRISLQVQTTEFDTGELKGDIQWQVIDIEKHVLGMIAHHDTTDRTIQQSIMKATESITNDLLFTDSHELSSQIESAIEPTFFELGLKLIKTDLRE